MRIRLGQQDDGGQGLAVVNRRVADPLVKIVLCLGAKDRLIGRADGAEHPREPAHLLFAVFARNLVIEIVERKRHVRSQALQQRNNLLVQRMGFAPRDHEHADAAAVADQRQRCGGADVAFRGSLAPGLGVRIVQIVVADA